MKKDATIETRRVKKIKVGKVKRISAHMCTHKKSSYYHKTRQECGLPRDWQMIKMSKPMRQGIAYHRGGSRRPRNTNVRDDSAIIRATTSLTIRSLESFRCHLPQSRHSVVPRETLQRRLVDVGIRRRQLLKRLPLAPHHRQCQMDFCQPRASWSMTDWRDVTFSDESRFNLNADEKCIRIWRRSGHETDAAFFVERHTVIT
ncbi:HTH_Tnp_Tc3_2 domain-containing protein [Trichonephila clavipes]|nr:HTH_Tnp_Tc3_2 domain-containing protein [Trichonephila clavipes]